MDPWALAVAAVSALMVAVHVRLVAAVIDEARSHAELAKESVLRTIVNVYLPTLLVLALNIAAWCYIAWQALSRLAGC